MMEGLLPAPEEPAQPMRVLHVIRAPVGGAFRHVRDLIRSQHSSGVEVGLVCNVGLAGDFELQAVQELTSHLRLGLHHLSVRRGVASDDMSNVLRVKKLLRQLNIDVIHGHGAKGGFYSRLASAGPAGSGLVASVYTPHGGSLHYSRRNAKGYLVLKIERLLQRFTHAIIHVSDFESTVYEHKVGGSRVMRTVIHNGLHADEYQPLQGVSADYDFLFLGALRTLKGIDVLVAAVNLLKTSRPTSVAIVGLRDPETAVDYTDLVAAMGLTESIEFLSPMPTRQALSLGRCLVVPSRAESLPYVVLEAAAAAIPVIATNVGGIAEVLGGQHLIPADDPDALSAAMRAFLDSPQRFYDTANDRRTGMMSKFAVETMTVDTIAAYKRALASRRSRFRRRQRH